MKLQRAISITNIKLVKQDYSTVSVEAVVGRVQERYKQGKAVWLVVTGLRGIISV